MTILRRRKRQRFGTREETRVRCPAHLQFVRGFTCIACGRAAHVCEGPIQACHVRRGAHAPMGDKPGDDRTYPACALAHKEQHDTGEAAFERKYGCNLEVAAAHLWRLDVKNRIRWEQKVHHDHAI